MNVSRQPEPHERLPPPVYTISCGVLMNMYPLGQPRTHRILIECKSSVYGLPGVVLDIGETGCLIWRRSSQLAVLLRTKHARFV